MINPVWLGSEQVDCYIYGMGNTSNTKTHTANFQGRGVEDQTSEPGKIPTAILKIWCDQGGVIQITQNSHQEAMR